MPASAAKPRVSILIPNYNNGIETSKNQQHDLIGQLLDSLRITLADDPTPLEILAFDDGSTDDSLATLRDWSQRTWRGGQAFLQLMGAEHCGVLSITANKLVQASCGDILVRLDGDVQCLTPNWATKLCEIFDHGPPRLGVVGPKQLMSDARIHAFGDFIFHPKGYHHVGQGLERYAITRPMEVDHVMGCFYCCRRTVYDEVDGFDENMLRGQTVDFGVAARLKGWSCIAVPHIEFAHHHGLRESRTTKADTEAGVDQTLAYFREKWGFCRIAPDLNVVREKYAGTPLLWNAAVFGTGVVEEARPWAQPTNLEETMWGVYASDEVYRNQINLRVQALLQVFQQVRAKPVVAVPHCGVGLIPHLLATQGVRVIASEPNPHEAALARQVTESHTYPGEAPTILDQPNAQALPFEDEAAAVVMLCDIVQRHRNPAALLAESGRILEPDGRLMVITRQPPKTLPGPTDTEHPYHVPELVGQIKNASGCVVINDPRPRADSHPMIAIAQPWEAYAAGREKRKQESVAA